MGNTAVIKLRALKKNPLIVKTENIKFDCEVFFNFQFGNKLIILLELTP